jgi:hypothetical protein
MHKHLSTAFAIVSSALCVAGFVVAAVSWLRAPRAFRSYAQNDGLKKGLELRIELSSKLFDLGLLLLGVLWGFVLAKEGSIHFSHWQDIVLFVSSNLLLLISLLCHLVYRLHLANMVWDLAVPPSPPASESVAPPSTLPLPDIRDAYVDVPFKAQWMLFFAALISGLCTILAVKVLGG